MTGNQGTPDRRPNSDRDWAARQPANSRIPAWKPRTPVPQSHNPQQPPKVQPPQPQQSPKPQQPLKAQQPLKPQQPLKAQQPPKIQDAPDIFHPLEARTASPQTVPSVAPSEELPPYPTSSAATPHPAPSTDRLSALLVRFHLPRSWQFWGATAVLAFSSIGVLSALALFRLPAIPNCPAIFWPTASASLRIYCAQMTAERRTVDDLLKAIALVNGLPQDHPLRDEINRNVEDWAKEILELGEESFQRGNLSEAIETAKRIPKNTSARQLVDKQIQDWRAIWTRAEGIYQEAEAALHEQNLRQAFLVATRLLDVGNRYWASTKYRELNNLITTTREDSNKLGKAKELADAGGLANLLQAIKITQEIKQTSPLYDKAQKLATEFGRSMLDLAEATLDRRDYDGAIQIVEQIPDKTGLKSEIKDFRILAEAQAQAWSGTVDDIEAAIVRAQKLGRDRPLYSRAQQLISYWQLEIQDVQRLARARQLAQPGTLGDLRAAIAEAQMIPTTNPRGSEAQKQIDQWRTTIETTEDRPYLNRAEQLAASGDVASLQSAISEASRIGSGRSLYDEARGRIATWRSQIQRIQDQPLLDQARLLANTGNLSDAITMANRISSERALYSEAQADVADWTDQLQRSQDQPLLDLARRYANQGNLTQAIAVAQQITAGRALYDEAQTEIASWQGQSAGQTRLQQALDAASLGTVPMLVNAIQIAHEIPANNPSHAEAAQLIDRWSWQLLDIAQAQASVDVPAAISIVQRIPDYTEAYSTAQQQARSWRQQATPVIQQP